MEVLIGGTMALLGGGGAAAGGAGAVSMAGGAAASAAAGFGGASAAGSTLLSVLQGTATVLGVLSSLSAADAEAGAMEAQAADADAEQGIETLNGIQRRTSIKAAMADALGAQDVAYAASGVDLSFGTARAARQDAFRETDLALTSDAGTEMTRNSRLMERAAGYRQMAKRVRKGGRFKALMSGVDYGMGLLERG